MDEVRTLKIDNAARQGVTEHNVRYVLASGLAGIISAFIIIAVYLKNFGITLT